MAKLFSNTYHAHTPTVGKLSAALNMPAAREVLLCMDSMARAREHRSVEKHECRSIHIDHETFIGKWSNKTWFKRTWPWRWQNTYFDKCDSVLLFSFHWTKNVIRRDIICDICRSLSFRLDWRTIKVCNNKLLLIFQVFHWFIFQEFPSNYNASMSNNKFSLLNESRHRVI